MTKSQYPDGEARRELTVYTVLNWRGQWKRQGDSKIPKQGETLTKHMPKPSPTQPPLEPQHQEENSI